MSSMINRTFGGTLWLSDHVRCENVYQRFDLQTWLDGRQIDSSDLQQNVRKIGTTP